MASLGDLFVTVGAKIDGFERAMGSVNKNLKDLDKEWSGATAGFDKMFNRLESVGTTLSASVTLPLTGLGLAVANVAGKLEQSTVAFTTLLGSAKAAGDYLEQLKAFAAATPFEFPELVNASKKMLAMGFSANELIPTLRIIGDAVSALGGGAAEIDRVTLALGQMRAKGIVSAEEIRQLAEVGIPAWEILAKAIGVTIPEAMKLAEQRAIESSVAVPAILEGMNKKFAGSMEAQSKTLIGQWSNFKDQITFVLMDLGNVLLPIFKDVLKAALPLLEMMKSLSSAFASLPGPLQTAVIGFVGLAAAIGPITLAIGALGSAVPSLIAGFTLLSTAMKTMLIAPMLQLPVMIGNISVALSSNLVGALSVAEKGLLGLGYAAAGAAAIFLGWKLGQWAYENIPGVKALGDAIGGLIGMIPGVESIMNRLTGATEALGHANKDAEGQTKLFEARLKSHGLTLDRGTMSAQEYNEKALKLLKTHKDSEDAVKGESKAREGVNKQYGQNKEGVEKLSKAYLDWEKANESARASANQSNVVWRTTQEEVRRVSEKKEALIRSIVELKIQLKEQPGYINAVNQSLDEMALSLEAARNESNKLKGSVPEMADTLRVQLRDIPKATGYLEDAFRTLGIKSSTTFDEMAKDAEEAYKAVMGSGIATDWEKKNALLAMLKAQAEAMKANGKQIPEDMKKLMDDLEGAVDSKKPDITGPNGAWTKLAASMAQVVGDLSKDLIDSLFEGDKSWAEKGKAALQNLGKAVLSAFVTPATQAIQDFISGVLTDLLSGKGFGALLDKIKGIGTAITDIFGGGGSAAGAMTGAGSAAGTGAGIPTGPGGTGGVSGAVSSAVQWATAIGSIGSFVTGAISNFQNMAMNKSLDLIVKHTLQMVMIGEVMYEMSYNLLTQIHDRLITLINHGIGIWNAEGDTLRVRTDRDGELFFHLESMDFGVSQLNYTMLEIKNALIGFPDAVANMGGIKDREYQVPIVVNVDGREVARALVNYLDVQGARA